MNLNIFAALHTRLSRVPSARQSERYKCGPLADTDTDTNTDTFADTKCKELRSLHFLRPPSVIGHTKKR